MIIYAITDPITLNFNNLEDDLEYFSLTSKMIVYRDKLNKNYTRDAKTFLIEAKKHSFDKILLHSDYELAHKLKATGVHLKSTQLNDIAKAKELELFVIISTHTIEESLEAENLGADMVTFSPIFETPDKGKPKGIETLNHLSSLLTIPLIALGGIITQHQIELCEKNGAKGFASIRWFLKN